MAKLKHLSSQVATDMSAFSLQQPRCGANAGPGGMSSFVIAARDVHQCTPGQRAAMRPVKIPTPRGRVPAKQVGRDGITLT